MRGHAAGASGMQRADEGEHGGIEARRDTSYEASGHKYWVVRNNKLVATI